jgi:hypothetical protein
VEFIAAITWLAELFPDKRTKELVLGYTQAFASVGGILVTAANHFTVHYADLFPALPVPEPFNSHASWRYTLMTGLLPAIPIALLLPFVPESPMWTARRKAGTLRRPSIFELFSPKLRRITLVTTALSACAYAAAFGMLQMTPTRVVPGLPDLAEERKQLLPLREEAVGLNRELNALMPEFRQAAQQVEGLQELAGRRAKVRVALRNATRAQASADAEAPPGAAAGNRLEALKQESAQLDAELDRITAGRPEVRKIVIEREQILGRLGANRERQEPYDTKIKARGNTLQFFQEMGGLAGRIALALLIAAAIPRRILLRLFQAPGLLIVPLTYIYLFRNEPELFKWGVGLAGFLTIAQFSYFGEYLPKVFPLHLRGTGGSFATNVGGRMIGTSAAFVTANLVAPLFSGTTFQQVALAAAVVGTTVFLLGFLLSFLLPEPKAEGTPD